MLVQTDTQKGQGAGMAPARNGDLASPDDMTVEDLVGALEQAAAGMTQGALVRATGLSARTLRQLMDRHSTRVFGRPTLNKLDHAFGWDDGYAWRLYRAGQAPPDRAAELAAEAIALIEQRLGVGTAAPAPPWAVPMLDAMRPLSPRDRDLLAQQVIQLAHRLSGD